MKRSLVRRWLRSATAATVLLIATVAGVAADDEDDGPSLELLEFLGEWENTDGTWVDPLQLQDLDEEEMLPLLDE